MDVGAPEPHIEQRGSQLFLAYFTPADRIAVVRFDDVRSYWFGPPSDERLDEHLLYGEGLKSYSFFEVTQPVPEAVDPVEPPRHWIATFHDDTLEVYATSAVVVATAATHDTPAMALSALLASSAHD